MAEANSSGQIRAPTKETSSKTTSTEKESTDGLTAEFTAGSGSTTRWRAKAPSLGVTAVATSAATRTTRSMVRAHSSGPTVASTWESGAKASSTVKACMSRKAKNDRASGKWARGLNGLKPLPHQLKVARTDRKIKKIATI